MRTFKFDRDPYGFVMYRKSSLALEPGVTILIGCNGAGKTIYFFSSGKRTK